MIEKQDCFSYSLKYCVSEKKSGIKVLIDSRLSVLSDAAFECCSGCAFGTFATLAIQTFFQFGQFRTQCRRIGCCDLAVVAGCTHGGSP